MIKKFVIIPSVLFLFFSFHVRAADPSVTSFLVSPASVTSGQPVSFTWTLADAGGYSFYIPCSPGIKIIKLDGGTFACDARLSSTSLTNDSLTLFMYNASGGTKNIFARIVPKTSSGQDFDIAKNEATISVATIANPITSFTASASTTQLGVPVTLSWTSQYIDGVNLQIECKDNITVSSPSFTAGFMPCGSPIFTPNLSGVSSLTLNFSNSSFSSLPYRLTLLPMISLGSYDATHAARYDFTVSSDIIPDPVVNHFSATTTTANSGDEVLFSWGTSNVGAVNFRIACPESLTASSSQDASFVLPCDKNAFASDLSANGNLKLYFQNLIDRDRAVTVTLVPSKKTGEYDLTHAKALTIVVRPLKILATNPVQPSAPVVVSSSPVLPVTAPPASFPVKSKTIFVSPLRRGSSGAQVRALQEILKNLGVYPEGIIIGIFGPATERAVKRFQVKYGISSGGPGYGTVGPKTRTKLNEFSR